MHRVFVPLGVILAVTVLMVVAMMVLPGPSLQPGLPFVILSLDAASDVEGLPLVTIEQDVGASGIPIWVVAGRRSLNGNDYMSMSVGAVGEKDPKTAVAVRRTALGGLDVVIDSVVSIGIRVDNRNERVVEGIDKEQQHWEGDTLVIEAGKRRLQLRPASGVSRAAIVEEVKHRGE